MAIPMISPALHGYQGRTSPTTHPLAAGVVTHAPPVTAAHRTLTCVPSAPRSDASGSSRSTLGSPVVALLRRPVKDPFRDTRRQPGQSTATSMAPQISRIRVSANRPSRLTSTATEAVGPEDDA